MTNNVKKIVDTLDKTKDNLGKAKGKVGQWLDEIGYQQEVTDLQSKIWKALISVQSMPTSVTASGVSLSQTMLNQSNHLLDITQNSGIDESLNTAGTALTSLSGVSFSAISSSPFQNNPPQAYIELNRILTQRNQQPTIASKLGSINQSLRNEYENAWAGLYSSVDDKTRSPMFLMREVVRRLYDNYAPDDQVMKLFPELQTKKDVKRQHKVKYIANKIDPWKRQAFLVQEKAFIDIYNELSKAHKDGKLDIEETRGILLQADGLIKLLLDSLS